MRLSISLAICSLAATAAAEPRVTTQACLGSFSTFLACPPGAQVSDHQCRAREPHRGQAPGEHWSGSQRQGPSLFLRDDAEPDPAKQRVSFAAFYKNHKKTGRVFRFDADGRLESWVDVDADRYHGASVSCLPDGRVRHLAYYKHDRTVGISRSWRERDGELSYAFQYDAAGHPQRIEPTAAQRQRPDHLCQPVTCDVAAKPDLSGVP